MLFCTTALFLAQAAIAADVTVSTGTTETTTQTIDEDGDTLTVEEGGTIDTTAAGTQGVRATGDNQTVINRGTIKGGKHIGLDEDDGIEIEGSSGSTINNTDTGTVWGEEFGIHVDESDNITVNNAGTIEGATEDGIRLDLSDNITITNTGSIIGGSNDDGIRIDESLEVTVINDGSIDAYDDGIDMGDSHDATIINNGSIIVTNDNGIDFDDSHRVTIVNNGRIEANGDGIDFDVSNDATIINNGTIIAREHGVDVSDYSLRAKVVNNGWIESTRWHGIHVSLNSSNTEIINNGTIKGGNWDHGISIEGSFDTEIVNNGTVTGNINGIAVTEDENGTASDGVKITNRGTIAGGTYAIYIDSTSTDITLNLLPGSVIDGALGFFGTGLMLNIGEGLNLYFSYAGTIETPNFDIPHVHDETNGVIYTVDPSGFALSQAFIQTTADAVHEAVRDGAGRGNAFGGGFSGNSTFAYGTGDPGFDTAGPRGWVSGFGGYQQQNGTGNTTGGDQAYGGLVSGGGLALEDRIYGAFLGGSYARLETDYDTQKIEAASFYGGLYGGARSGPYWISGALLAGYSEFSSDRTVANNTVAGGLETASADYGGYFISPSVTVGRSIGERTEISVGGHYAGLFLDGYTESGSSANLTVASRAAHVAAVRAKATYLAGQQQMWNGLVSVETWAGIDGVFNFGDNVEASVAAGAFDAFSASFAEAAAIGFAGIGLNHRPDSGNWSINTSLEGRYGTDAFTEIRASATAAVTF